MKMLGSSNILHNQKILYGCWCLWSLATIFCYILYIVTVKTWKEIRN